MKLDFGVHAQLDVYHML